MLSSLSHLVICGKISFPYYLKATLSGDGIAFQHIDLNTKKYLRLEEVLNALKHLLH